MHKLLLIFAYKFVRLHFLGFLITSVLILMRIFTHTIHTAYEHKRLFILKGTVMDKINPKKQNELMKKPVPKTPEERSETEEIILDNFCGCCSSNDCTGLIPSDPGNRTAADEYRNVVPYAVPDPDGVPYHETNNSERKTFGKPGTHGGV